MNEIIKTTTFDSSTIITEEVLTVLGLSRMNRNAILGMLENKCLADYDVSILAEMPTIKYLNQLVRLVKYTTNGTGTATVHTSEDAQVLYAASTKKHSDRIDKTVETRDGSGRVSNILTRRRNTNSVHFQYDNQDRVIRETHIMNNGNNIYISDTVFENYLDRIEETYKHSHGERTLWSTASYKYESTLLGGGFSKMNRANADERYSVILTTELTRGTVETKNITQFDANGMIERDCVMFNDTTLINSYNFSGYRLNQIVTPNATYNLEYDDNGLLKITQLINTKETVILTRRTGDVI